MPAALGRNQLSRRRHRVDSLRAPEIRRGRGGGATGISGTRSRAAAPGVAEARERMAVPVAEEEGPANRGWSRRLAADLEAGEAAHRARAEASAEILRHACVEQR